MQHATIEVDREIVLIDGVATSVCVVRHDIRRVGVDGDGCGEVRFLPAGGRFTTRRGRREQCSTRGPQIDDMRASVIGVFVETHADH